MQTITDEEINTDLEMSDISAKQLMIASESLIAKDWDTPEEDRVWADL